MKSWFDKYADVCTEKLALMMIHIKLHKVIKEYKDGKPYVQDLHAIYNMIGDMLKEKGVKI